MKPARLIPQEIQTSPDGLGRSFQVFLDGAELLQVFDDFGGNDTGRAGWLACTRRNAANITFVLNSALCRRLYVVVRSCFMTMVFPYLTTGPYLGGTIRIND